MLILTRNIGKTLCIGDNITITVLDIKGAKVSLGITAPAHIEVHRKEIYDRIQQKESQREKS